MRGGLWSVGVFVGIVLTPAMSGAQEELPGSVRTYLNGALNIMEANVLGADTVDWEGFRAEVYRRAAGAERPEEAYEVLRWALARLNPHSFLFLSDALREREMEVRGEEAGQASEEGTAPVLSPFRDRRRPTGRLVERDGFRVGIVAVPRFGASHAGAFADSIQDLIRDQDRAGACGWIVDLRGNGGGNMWPMLAGLGPLLPEGDLGSFHADGRPKGSWYLEDGATGVVRDGERSESARVSEAYRLDRHPPVAVLFDRGTISSGEATAIAFIGRSDTRSFGVSSYGFTTSNSTFRLRDGARIVLTTGIEADRNGTLYPSGLEPDRTVPYRADGTVPEAPPPEDEDPQVEAALSWLSGHAACAAGGSG